MALFIANRQRFPPEEMLQYAKQYVAWSPEGTHILASGKDPIKLKGIVRDLGYDPADVCISFVPDPNEILLGGVFVE